MDRDEWEGWPALGTRVRLPYGTMTLVGEVVGHRWFGMTPKPMADVRVQVPGFHVPYDDECAFDPDDDESWEPRVIDVPLERAALHVIPE